MVFCCNPDFPGVLADSLPALDRKTCSQIIAGNQTVIPAGCKVFIQTETSENIGRALRSQIRTSTDVKHFSVDSVYLKRNNCDYWKGPDTVFRQGQQVLVKHVSI